MNNAIPTDDVPEGPTKAERELLEKGIDPDLYQDAVDAEADAKRGN